MVNQTIWIGITVGVFFAGIGISYGLFANTVQSDSLKLSQQAFDQMMSQNPKMAQQWLDTMMQDPQFMQAMIQNDEFMHEMMVMMSEQGMMEGSMMDPSSMIMKASPIEQHETMLELMEHILEEKQLRDHMLAHMIENQKLVHQMFTLMDQSPELKNHMEAHVSGNITGYKMLETEE